MAKILIVDDDEEFLRLISEHLSKEGHQITSAADGEIAEKLLGKEAFDLVISDIRMPHINGIDLLRWLKGHQSTPIILMSGFAPIETAEEGLALGADDFLAKPFTFDALKRSIDLCLRGESPLLKKFGETKKSVKKERLLFASFSLIAAIASAVLGLTFLIFPKNQYLKGPELGDQFKREVSKLREDQLTLSKEIDNLKRGSVLPNVTKFEKRLSSMEQQLDNLGGVILQSPYSALSVTMLRKDLDGLSARHDKDVSALKENLSFFGKYGCGLYQPLSLSWDWLLRYGTNRNLNKLCLG